MTEVLGFVYAPGPENRLGQGPVLLEREGPNAFQEFRAGDVATRSLDRLVKMLDGEIQRFPDESLRLHFVARILIQDLTQRLVKTNLLHTRTQSFYPVVIFPKTPSIFPSRRPPDLPGVPGCRVSGRSTRSGK